MTLVSAQEHRRTRRPGLVDPNILVFSGYKYYASVTIQSSKVLANHSNFPFLIYGTFDGTGGEPDLRTTANGGKIENTVGNGGASGSLTVPADFVVAPNNDGTSKFDFEVVLYNASTGEIAVWVKKPTMDSSSNETVYMAYGDSGVTASQENVSGVWSNSYVAVLHLAENPTGTLYDSTGNGHNGSSSGSMTSGDQISTKLGYGLDFDGSNDRIVISHSSALNPGHMTLDFLMEADSSVLSKIVDKRDAYSIFFDRNNDNDINVATYGGNQDFGASLSTSVEYVIGARGDNGTRWDGWVDGTKYTMSGLTDDFTNQTRDLHIGGGLDSGLSPEAEFDGKIAEFRLSNTLRSDNWQETTANTFDVSTFLSFGSEVAR